MGSTLRQEIQQERPFRSLREEALLNLMRSAQRISDANEAFFHAHGLTRTQYNVLRILRGAGESGLGRNEIRERLISRMPDVTRLLDRMEDLGLVQRRRSLTDRRSVPTHLTDRGRELVDQLDALVDTLHEAMFAGLDEAQLAALVKAMTQLRQNLSTTES